MLDNAERFELSPQQEELWSAQPDGPTARLQASIDVRGALDVAALKRALAAVVQRHESLRTTFIRQPGLRIPLQTINTELEPGWTETEASGRDQDRRALEPGRELEAAFDLAGGSPIRAQLLSDGEERHQLVLTVSALCADPASMSVLLAELAAEYGGSAGELEEPLQYADFSAWQRELLDSDDDEARAAGEFWAGMEDAASPELPFTRAPVAPAAPASVALGLDRRVAVAIAAAADRYGVSAHAFVQAAWHALLGRFAGEEDTVVAFVGVERRHSDLDGAVGAFARPVPVRARTGGEVTFAETLHDVDGALRSAPAWQDYAPIGAASRVTAGFLGCTPSRARAGDVEFALARLLVRGPFRLSLTCMADDSGLDARIDFDPGSHSHESVERLARGLERVLEVAAADPGIRLGMIDVLDEAERKLLLENFNDTGAPLPSSPVHELISRWAGEAASREAVRDERGAISYGELTARANQLANRLRRSGVGPDQCVALCTDRSVEMVVGLLGILKAGGAYVPLHYEHPPARLSHQLSTAGAVAIVTQAALLERLPEFAGEVVCLDRDRPELDAEPAIAPVVEVSAENLAYVIYTSGSTGAPKGVGVTHGNLANYATDIARQLGSDSAPLSYGVVTSISTDLGNTSVFGALCSGGTLVLVSPTAAADPEAMVAALDATRVDVLKITPSHIGALLAAGDARVLPRRWLVVGGERAPWDLISRVRSLSGCAVLNHYGPTETTIGSCTFVVGEGPGEYGPASVPIGRPIANTACYILDEQRRPVPIGVRGRLFIAGAGVARGYVGEPALTAERFLANPHSAVERPRMYDTGDLARWLPDGAIEFLGRSDEQVKIRGYRVEPAEVETALRSHARVEEAVVVSALGAAGETRLVAYCQAPDGTTADELRAHLHERLPGFMVPSTIATLPDLPRTPSGKIDRRALPDPETLMDAAARAYLAPRTPLEQTIAEIWKDILGVQRVGVRDDFFELGGHSLLAARVVAQVRSDFAVELPLHSLFSYPTVGTLANEIVRMMGDSDEEETARLLTELEALSDEEVERMLAGDVERLDR